MSLNPLRPLTMGQPEPGAQRAVQASLAALLFYSIYVALAGHGRAALGLSIVSIACLVGALLKTDRQRANRWLFPSVLTSWLLYLLASINQSDAPFVHWWPLLLLTSSLLLVIRQWVVLAVAVLTALAMTASGQQQANFLHMVALPFIAALLVCLYLALARSSMSCALQQALGCDLITGCDNKPRLQQFLQDALDSLQRYAIPTSVIVLQVQLTQGVRSDAMLQTLCTIWRSRLRTTDRLCRLSDDRFVCLLSNTPTDKAVFARDDLLKAVSHYEFDDKNLLLLTSAIIDISDMNTTADGMELLLGKECRC